jgi:hypothetical protein
MDGGLVTLPTKNRHRANDCKTRVHACHPGRGLLPQRRGVNADLSRPITIIVPFAAGGGNEARQPLLFIPH